MSASCGIFLIFLKKTAAAADSWIVRAAAVPEKIVYKRQYSEKPRCTVF